MPDLMHDRHELSLTELICLLDESIAEKEKPLAASNPLPSADSVLDTLATAPKDTPPLTAPQEEAPPLTGPPQEIQRHIRGHLLSGAILEGVHILLHHLREGIDPLEEEQANIIPILKPLADLFVSDVLPGERLIQFVASIEDGTGQPCQRWPIVGLDELQHHISHQTGEVCGVIEGARQLEEVVGAVRCPE